MTEAAFLAQRDGIGAASSNEFATVRSARPLRGLSRTSLFGLMSFLPAVLLAVPASAQSAPDASPVTTQPATSDEVAKDIVVTGTRISGFTSPTPLMQVGQLELQSKAVSTVSDMLSLVPQLRLNQNIGKSSEPVGGSNVDLRGLGTQRTLVLMNGKRVALTDPAGTIDTNIIPIALVKSVDIVTGGASAAYGSDAVSGVVNFVLDDKFEGLKLDGSYGISKYGDHKRPAVNGAWGKSFLDGRLRMTFAGDFMHNSGQTAQGKRDWGDDASSLLTNPAYTATNGQPRLLIVDNSVFTNMTAGGVMTRNAANLALATRLGFASGQGFQFNSAGQPVAYNYGTNIGGTFMTGGDGAGRDISYQGNILPEIRRIGAYGRISFEPVDHLTFYADLLFSQVNVNSDLTPNPDNGTITIRNDNYYLAPTVKTAMAAQGVTSFSIGRMNYEDGYSLFKNRTRTYRGTFGAQGDFGASWKWDVGAQMSRNSYQSLSYNNRIDQRFTYGLDAVNNPANGQAICRVTLNNPGATDATDPYRDIRDCKPINPFGAGSINQTALDYYRGTSVTRAYIQESVYTANLSGKPLSTWAGPISIAVGAEYRDEKTTLTADANSAARRWRSINSQPFTGKYDVKEAYGELVVPLAKDSPLLYNLDVNGAVRFTDYSTSGSVTTWKAGLNYAPIPGLRFRGTISRDIRAPNNYDLYSRGNQVISGIIDPVDNVARNTVQITSGNSALVPEKADTKTIGVIWNPGFLPGFQASVDFYSIKLKDAITSIAAQDIANFCFRGQTQYCPAVIRGGVGGTISQINIVPFNASSQKTSGLDIETQYRFALGKGKATFRSVVNYVREISITTPGGYVDYLGQEGASAPPGGLPKWRINVDGSYAIGRFNFGLTYRYIGGGVYDVRYNVTTYDLANNAIKGRSYVDLSASYKLTKNVELYGRVENLFDQDPPIAPTSITQPTIANSVFFDRRGTYGVVGARLKF